MQKYNNIIALFFLAVFSMLLLHQILPHRHHEHEVDHSHKAIAHSDSHSHQHDAPEKESHDKDFLDLFLEIHVHSEVSHEILLTYESSLRYLIGKKNPITTSSSANYCNIILDDEAETRKVDHPPNNYFNTYTSSSDSRGPPSLG